MGYLQVGGSNSQGSLSVRIFVISAQNISDKGFKLDFLPNDVTTVILVPAGGAKQNYGTDYTITDGFLTWDGLGLEGLIAADDSVFLYY
jgi:hypothetical protein